MAADLGKRRRLRSKLAAPPREYPAYAKLTPMAQHCCEVMARQVNWHCDHHDDPYDCADVVVRFSARFQEYGLVIHDGGTSSIGIDFCPWCGQRLPTSQRNRWFDELEERGIDPWTDEIPPEFQDDRWLHGASER